MNDVKKSAGCSRRSPLAMVLTQGDLRDIPRFARLIETGQFDAKALATSHVSARPNEGCLPAGGGSDDHCVGHRVCLTFF